MKKPYIKLSIEEYDALLLKGRQSLSEIQSKDATIQSQERTIQSLQLEVAQQRWLIEDLQRRLWGQSSDKRQLPEQPQELDQCYGSPVDVTDPIAESQKAEVKAKKSEDSYNRFRKDFKGKKVVGNVRKPIDSSLPRETRNVPMPEGIDLKGAVKLDDEITEQYAIHPAQVVVIRIVRPTYKLADGRIVTAPMPTVAYPRSNASASALTHIAVAKYEDHLPLHRQIEMFERSGVHLSASTVSNWMMAAAQRLEPVYNELRELVKNTDYVMADETPHKVLECDRPGSLHNGYMWVYYLPNCKTPFFDYRKGRDSTGADLLLSSQVKAVQSDGYAAYNVFDTLDGKLHLCCWAHVRRKFVEAQGNDPVRAKEALDMIAKIYMVEREIKENNLSDEQIVHKRQTEAYPVIKELECWCKRELDKTVENSPIAKAMSYMYKRFEQLSHYVNNAQFQIDNNPVERSIRPLTLNRKNTLFSGSHDAAHCAAIFFTLFGCCRENNVNPNEWMNDVLIKIQDEKYAKENNYSQLIPFNWK